MSNKTLIEWNADVGTRFLTIHPDGSFDIDKDAPPLFVIGELAKAFIRQQDRIKRLEEFVEQLTNPKFTRDDLPKEALLQRIKRLEEALEGTVKWIVHLADSGDAGFWDVEKQSEIIAARAALKKESKP